MTVTAKRPNPRRFRKALSRAQAQAMTLVGKPRGFFTQYRWAGSVDPDVPPYDAIEEIFGACVWREFLGEMASHRSTFQGFGVGDGDPRWSGGRMFSPLDGMAAYTAVRHFRPRRVIEIGSGDSTYFLSRGVRDAGGDAEMRCIDPAPQRAIRALPVTLEQRLLTIDDTALCGELEAGDILFIDSSHIMLPGMDVDIQFNRMFPRLKPGVVVHVHDIFLPDAYPPSWAPRNYNEQQALIGWIASGFFRVVYPGNWVATRHADAIDRAFDGDPLVATKSAGSIWLQRS